MTYDRPLMPWLSGGRYYQKSLAYIMLEDFVLQHAWLAIDLRVDLHEACNVALRPFDSTWEETQAYIEKACEMLGRHIPGWAPELAESDRVRAALGDPPLRSYAIYLITVEKADKEVCVYVGQTNSKHHRFRSGHAALSALHHPEYDGLKKRIYFAGLQLDDDDDHSFPIEWVHPVELRRHILDSVEGRLIFDLQPILNTQGKDRLLAPVDLPITAQNMTGRFLDAVCFGPPVPEDD